MIGDIMQISRISQQQPETLEEFYLELANDDRPAWSNCGNMMLDLINHLRNTVYGPPLRASTAHHDLILVEPNERKRVVCSAWLGKYKIACRARSDDTLWDNTQVVGYTNSIIEAGLMLINAFKYAPEE
jgi:hypothetical protein